MTTIYSHSSSLEGQSLSSVPISKHLPKAPFLSFDQARDFLQAIPVHKLQGKRDYALFLAYLVTGRSLTQVRLLRYGDFEQHSGKMWFRWKYQGRILLEECPPCVWEAVMVYLISAGRIPAIRPQEFLFIPLNHNASNFPHLRTAERLDNYPITPGSVTRLLKKYARLARLDPARVTIPILHHTSAWLQLAARDDVDGFFRSLGDSLGAVAQAYQDLLEAGSAP